MSGIILGWLFYDFFKESRKSASANPNKANATRKTIPIKGLSRLLKASQKATTELIIKAIQAFPINPISIIGYKSLASSSLALAQSQLTQSEHLNYYASQIEAHARAIVRLNEVLEKLDKLLDRKGNEGI